MADASSAYPLRRYAADAVPVLLAIGVLGAMILSLSLGVYPIPVARVAHIVGALAWPFPLPDHVAWTAKEQTVVQVVRLPRVIVATMAGVGLGISGASLQGMMRNPLVSPDLVGVTSGAACGAVLALMLDLPSIGVVGLGLAGGLLALTCTLLLARASRGAIGSFAVILAGVFVGAFFAALVGIIEYTSDSHTQLPGMVYWLLGSFVNEDPRKVAIITIPTLGAGALLLLLRWRINLLSLADLDATALGFNATRVRLAIILLVSLLVAAQVAVSGVVGWVGLVVPHFARMLVGPDHRRLLPVAALLGGLLTLLLDDVSRTLFSQEIPVGLLTAVVGTPVICFLFWRTRGRGWINE